MVRSSLAVLVALLAGCGTENALHSDTGSDTATTTTDTAPSYTVGGTVTGLAGSGLVLQLNGGDDLPIDADGHFAFAGGLADGADYTVTVSAAPTGPNQDCAVSNGTGTIAGAGVGDVAVDCTTPLHTVSVNVSGLTGQGLLVQLNGGDDMAIDASGTATFSNALAEGDNYAVTVRTQPTCPGQVCTLTGGTGVMGTSDVTVPVTCGDARIRLFTSNWGDDSIDITDDLLSQADGSTVTPQQIAGTDTTITNPGNDAIAADGQRSLVYLADQGVIKVFDATASGDVAPLRTFGVDSDTLTGVEADPADDRVYAAGTVALYVFDGASTLDGTVTPPVVIPDAQDDGALTYDPVRDRLYVRAGPKTVWVFDAARNLSSDSTPDRTITWTSGGFAYFWSLAVDGCNERLYLGSNVATPGGGYLVVIPASTSGQVDLDHIALAEYAQNPAITIHRDAEDHLYVMQDSATAVWVFDAASTWSGEITANPDLTVNGVVNKGYGLDTVAY